MTDIGNADSTRPCGSDPRRQTIAFRLTSSEREGIDALARSERISTSEFARQAVIGGLQSCTSALDEARAQGRDDMRAEIDALENDLALMRKLAADSESSARDLYAQLTRAPDELLAAARQLVAGVRGSQVTLAIRWSRIDYHDRCKILPILATVVADEVDRVVAKLHVNEDHVDWGHGLLRRIEWLMVALTPDSGRLHAATDPKRRPEWAPLQASWIETAESLCISYDLLKQRETRSAATELSAHGEELEEERSILRKPATFFAKETR
jgi:hypothetical protein